MEINKIRKENMDILEKWYKSIERFEKLDILDAKELYIKFLKEKDENKKAQLRDKLIYGCLHIIYKFLKKSRFIDFKSPSYTMDDIISESINYLIKSIDEGKILKISYLSSLFKKCYYMSLSKKLIGTSQNIFQESLNFDKYKEILFWYFDLKNKGYDIDSNIFEDYMKTIFGFHNRKFTSFDYAYIYNTLNGFYTYCFKNNIDIKDEQFNIYLKNFIINIGSNIEKVNPKNIKTNENDEIIEEISLEELKDVVRETINSDLFTEREKVVLHMHFGINGEKATYEQIGKYLNISAERVRQIEVKALRKLRSKLRFKHIDKSNTVFRKIKSYSNDLYF